MQRYCVGFILIHFQEKKPWLKEPLKIMTVKAFQA